MKKYIYIVRHGETDYNAKGICQGQLLNEALNERGIKQAQNLIPLLRGKNIGAIYSSPMKRAKQTADIIADGLNMKVSVHKKLIEGNFGVADGMPMSIVKTWETYKLWTNPDRKYDDVHYENGESKKQIRQRVMEALTEICDNEKSEHILIVAHSAIVRFLNWYVGNNIQQIPNGSVYKFIFADGRLLTE